MGARACLVGQSNLFRAGLKLLLRQTPVEVISEAESLRKAATIPCAGDLVIVHKATDIRDMTGDLAALRRAVPCCRIVLLAGSMETDQMALAFAAGVDGYLLEEISPEALLELLQLVLLGEKVFPSRLAILMCSEGWTPHVTRNELPADIDLSDRELETLQSLTDGLPNKLIATRLSISEATVKVHIKTILKKLGAHNRTQAAIWAVQHGLSIAPAIIAGTPSNSGMVSAA